ELSRVARSKRIGSLVVATTTLPADDCIVSVCRDHDWHCFRGSEPDVLDRYYRCAREAGAEIVIRLTADCPLIEPAIIDRVVATFTGASPGVDYASNIVPRRTFPQGLDTEVMSFSALERSWNEDKDPALREHVTQYILRNPDKFTVAGVMHDRDLSGLRWTVDTKEDFRFVQEVYSFFGNNRFTWQDVLDLMEKKPELQLINRDIRQKEVRPS
ncbi:MAG: glycosyltransferase family protein, partial [Methanoregula sp.]|nr:glycosyltransferase family protein [Methanoregula sp.]